MSIKYEIFRDEQLQCVREFAPDTTLHAVREALWTETQSEPKPAKPASDLDIAPDDHGKAPGADPQGKPAEHPEQPAKPAGGVKQDTSPRPMLPGDHFFKNGLPIGVGAESSTPISYAADSTKEEVARHTLHIGSRYHIEVTRADPKNPNVARLQANTQSPRSLAQIRAELRAGRKMADTDRFLKDGLPHPKHQESDGLLTFLAGEPKLVIGNPAQPELVEAIALSEIKSGDKYAPDHATTQLPSAIKSPLDYRVSDVKSIDVTSIDADQLERMFQRCGMLSGIDLSGEGFEVRPPAALEIADAGAIVVSANDASEMTAEVTFSETARNRVECGFTKLDSKISTPWGGTSGDYTSKARSASADSTRSIYTVAKWKCPRMEVVFTAGSLRATKALEDAIRFALEAESDDRKFANLSQVFAYFGQVAATRVVLGAALISTRAEDASAKKTEEQLEWSARGALALNVQLYFSSESGAAHGQSSGDTSEDKALSQREQLMARGGNTLLANDPGAWLTSVSNYETWRPIDYREVLPLHAFLTDKDLRDRVHTVLNRHMIRAIGDIWSFSFTAGGDVLAISGQDRRLWRYSGDLNTWERLPNPKDDDGTFLSVAALADGSALLVPDSSDDLQPVRWSSSGDDSPQRVLRKTASGTQIDIERALWLAPLHGEDGVLIKSNEGGSFNLYRHSILDASSASQAVFLQTLQASIPNAKLPEGHPYSAGCAFQDGLVLLLRDVRVMGGAKEGQPAVVTEVTSRRELLCFDGSELLPVPNDQDLLALAVDLDDNLVAVAAEKRGTQNQWKLVSAAARGRETRAFWRSVAFLCCPDWRKHIQRDPASPPPPLRWIPFDPSTLGRHWLRRMLAEKDAAANAKIILFERENFSGQSIVLSKADKNLDSSKFNDKASSAIVKGGDWLLYKHTNFHGTAYAVSSLGGPDHDGLYPNAQAWGGKPSEISSVFRKPTS